MLTKHVCNIALDWILVMDLCSKYWQYGDIFSLMLWSFIFLFSHITSLLMVTRACILFQRESQSRVMESYKAFMCYNLSYCFYLVISWQFHTCIWCILMIHILIISHTKPLCIIIYLIASIYLFLSNFIHVYDVFWSYISSLSLLISSFSLKFFFLLQGPPLLSCLVLYWI